jgi:hypothetical protein
MSPYSQPIIHWLAALVGLVLALLSDGLLDALALLLLCAPLFAIGRHLMRSNG